MLDVVLLVSQCLGHSLLKLLAFLVDRWEILRCMLEGREMKGKKTVKTAKCCETKSCIVGVRILCSVDQNIYFLRLGVYWCTCNMSNC